MSQSNVISLADLKADHRALGEKIATFEQQPKQRIIIPAATIDLAAGEYYGGRMHSLDLANEPTYDLIVTEIRRTRLSFQDNLAWMKERNGVWNRREGALIYAHLRDLLKDSESVFWTGEEHAEQSGCAWCQYFDDGGQGWDYQYDTCYGLSVRRLIV